MQLFVLYYTLVLEVLLDGLFIGILPYGIHLITACPKLTAPEHLFHLWMKTENFPRRDTLYRPDHFLQGVPRNTLCQKMDMVPVKADLQKMNLVTLPDLKTNPLEGLRNGTAQNFSPIFDTAHKMVQKQAFVMALGDTPAHDHKYSNISTRHPRQAIREFQRLKNRTN